MFWLPTRYTVNLTSIPLFNGLFFFLFFSYFFYKTYNNCCRSHDKAKETEERLRLQVGTRLREIAEDHISIEQHTDIVRTKLESLQSEQQRELDNLTLELERETTER